HRGKLIVPGFVDTHVHYAQVDVIASYGRQLLDWLNDYTFPAERAFADPDHARKIAGLFLDNLLRHGTTTAAVYPTVHKQSVDAFFEAAQRRNLRMICGKNRFGYALTPRFAPTSSPEQLAMIGRLYAETPGLWMQTHLTENRDEIEWVKQLFPEAR